MIFKNNYKTTLFLYAYLRQLDLSLARFSHEDLKGFIEFYKNNDHSKRLFESFDIRLNHKLVGVTQDEPRPIILKRIYWRLRAHLKFGNFLSNNEIDKLLNNLYEIKVIF